MNGLHYVLVLAFVLTTFVPSCMSGRQPYVPTKTVLTFNTALYGDDDRRMERRDALISQLQKPGISSDVVCLQAVYYREDIRRMRDELRYMYPYTFSQADMFQDSATAQCEGPAYNALLQCIATSCPGIDDTTEEGRNQSVLCIATYCVNNFYALEQSCINCFFRITPPEGILRCGTYDPKIAMVDIGVLLLSKTRIWRPSVSTFLPFEAKRLGFLGFIQAIVKGLGTVVCSHQVPDVGPPYLEAPFLPYESYAEQNLAETKFTLNRFEDAGPLVLLGDYGTGPRVPEANIEPEMPESYAEFVSPQRGLSTVLLKQCSFCENNPFPGVFNSGPDRTTDHVFVREHEATCVSRVLDDNSAIPTPDLDVAAIPISDHYGVRGTFTVAKALRCAPY